MTKKSPKPTKLSQGRKTSQGRASAAADSFRSASGAGQGAHNPADLEVCAPARAGARPALPGSTHDKGLEIVTEEKRRVRGNLFPIVGIGASAGGFEAFTQFLNALAPDTGMAFVLVQHLDPKHKSRLTELLGYSSKMPVLEAKDDMEVEPNHIYVIPENANMTVAEGRLRLSPRKKTEMPPMPIDVFFRSLGHDQQNRAIGVVLSGTGSDGTLGVEAIKGEGGIVFAQSERSAKF